MNLKYPTWVTKTTQPVPSPPPPTPPPALQCVSGYLSIVLLNRTTAAVRIQIRVYYLQDIKYVSMSALYFSVSGVYVHRNNANNTYVCIVKVCDIFYYNNNNSIRRVFEIICH